MTQTLIISAVVIFVVVSLFWWRQHLTKNANSIDAVWALGIGIQTTVLALQAQGNVQRRWAIALLVGAWSLRLGGYLLYDRVFKSKEEDGRYARLRREWSTGAFYGLYLMQGVLIFLLPLSLLGGLTNNSAFPSGIDIVALVIWIISLAGESLADRQLAHFRADPTQKGKVCQVGLWHYSRHPNYFFEWLIWCSYIPLAVGSSYILLSFIGPVVLLFLLLKVSGIPMAEAQSLASRGDAYRAYQHSTSAFVPWFPKKGEQL